MRVHLKRGSFLHVLYDVACGGCQPKALGSVQFVSEGRSRWNAPLALTS